VKETGDPEVGSSTPRRPRDFLRRKVGDEPRCRTDRVVRLELRYRLEGPSTANAETNRLPPRGIRR